MLIFLCVKDPGKNILCRNLSKGKKLKNEKRKFKINTNEGSVVPENLKNKVSSLERT
jgi:hypothetical protein